MNKPNNINEKEISNSLYNLSDEELVDLKQKAVDAEDYLKAYEIKQEQKRREKSQIESERKEEESKKRTKIKDLQSELFEWNSRNLDEEIKEEYDTEDICEHFRPFAESLYIRIRHDVFKMGKEWKNKNEINDYYYKEWQELYSYLKNFCSWYAYNLSDDPKKNNNIIIKSLWLKDSFNNIYRRCLTLSDKFFDKEIDWEEYFESICELFYNIKENIYKTNTSWFYSQERAKIHMPWLW